MTGWGLNLESNLISAACWRLTNVKVLSALMSLNKLCGVRLSDSF